MQEFEIEFEVTSNEFEIDMSDKVVEIAPTLADLEITPSTERQEFTPTETFGFGKVVVDQIKLQDKVVTPTQEEQIIKADEEFNGLGQVTVEKVEPAEPVAIPYKPRWLSFYGCKETDLSEELSNIDGSELTSLYYAFYNCSNLKRLDFSNLDLSGVTDMSYTFYRCSSLEFLDLRTINIAGANNVGGMTFNRVPANCLVIVKDETDKTEVTSANVNFTNVKTVAEYEAEFQ